MTIFVFASGTLPGMSTTCLTAHSKCTGEAATRGGSTRSDGAVSMPSSVNSSTSGGKGVADARDRLPQLVRRHVPHELAGLDGVHVGVGLRRAARAEQHGGRIPGDVLELAERRDVAHAARADGGDPTDRPRHAARREGTVREARGLARWLVMHPRLPARLRAAVAPATTGAGASARCAARAACASARAASLAARAAISSTPLAMSSWYGLTSAAVSRFWIRYSTTPPIAAPNSPPRPPASAIPPRATAVSE